ncbi:MAG: hypothetical protein AB8B66_04290 [Rickettsiaceae bacterium]
MEGEIKIIELISTMIDKKILLCTLFLLACGSWKTGIANTLDISQPKFSSDWFSDNIKHWNKYKKSFENKKEVRCLEVGSYEGRSTLYIVENYCKNKDSVIYAIDTCLGSMEHDSEYEKDLYQRFTYNLKKHIDNKKA